MKIGTLEVSGLRSHRGNPSTLIDLADKRLVAIVGHTGAGKSSILEAITFVLFGESTYGGKAYEELSTDGRCEVMVKMTFTIGDEHFEMLRTVRPDVHGKFSTKVVYLRRVGGEGNVLAHREGVRDVDAAVTALLGGMNREQFCQAVLLAQNRFADLLEANPAQREALLDTLLGLNALHDGRRALQKTVGAATRNIDRLADRRANLPLDPAAEARAAKAIANSMAMVAQRAIETGERLAGLSVQAAELSRTANELEVSAGLRTTSEGPTGRDRLSEAATSLEVLAEIDRSITVAEEEATTALQAATQRLDLANDALGKVQIERGAAGHHQVVTEQLRVLGELVAEKPSQELGVTNAEAVLEKLNGDLETAREAASSAKASANQLREAYSTALETAQAAAESLNDGERVIEAVGSAVERLGIQLATVEDTAAELARVRLSVLEAERVIEPLTEQQASAAHALEKASQADSAATAAHGCHPGDDCPVCGRSLPDSWKQPKTVNLDGARKSLADADDALKEAVEGQRRDARAYDQVVGRLRSALISVVATQAELARLAVDNELTTPPQSRVDLVPGDAEPDAVLTAAVEGALAIRPVATTWFDALQATLTPLRQLKEETNARVVTAQTSLSSAEESQVTADGAVSATITALAAAQASFDGAVQACDSSVNRLATTLAAIDERWRQLVDLSVASTVETAKLSVAKDQAAVGAATQERTEAASEVQDHRQRLQDLEAQRSREVTTPLEGLRTSLRTLAELVNDLATRVGLTTAKTGDDQGTAALIGLVADIDDTARRAVEATNERCAELHRQVDALATPASEVLSSLVSLMRDADPEGNELGAVPDREDPLSTETRNLVQQIIGRANRRAAEAAGQEKIAKKAMKTFKELDQRIAALESWAVVLEGAIEVLRKDNFPKWARGLKIADLLEVASDHLAEMTDGRYRFDPTLRISDEAAGVVRKASTLSGGEKFEASLALALGVSETAGRSGVRIETLFLDEGFAGLDQSHLNRALDALESEVAAGRRIVLITHIGSVADRIPDVLLIQPDGAGGSKTKWLDEDERFELGADLDIAVP